MHVTQQDKSSNQSHTGISINSALRGIESYSITNKRCEIFRASDQGRTNDFGAPGLNGVMGPSHVRRDKVMREDICRQ